MRTPPDIFSLKPTEPERRSSERGRNSSSSRETNDTSHPQKTSGLTIEKNDGRTFEGQREVAFRQMAKGELERTPIRLASFANDLSSELIQLFFSTFWGDKPTHLL